MYLYFNKNGTLTTQINHGEVPRQGANLDVHALVDLDFFEEQGDYQLDDWTALLKVVDTLGNTALSGATMNGPKLITFVKSNNAEATFNLVNGQNYYAFDFLINSSIYSNVTALSGNIKIGVSFINTDSSLNVVGGECTLYIEPVLKDSYIKNNINPSQYRQLMAKIEQAEFYTSNNNYSVSYNLVVNRNGYQVPNVKFEPISIAQYDGYTVKQLRDNATNTKIEDISKIKEYLSAITGNERIPEYNESRPSDQFIICAADNTMWKMQYDETNGLLAFKVENVPLLPTIYLKTASVSGNTLTLTKQDDTTVTFTPSGGSGGGVTIDTSQTITGEKTFSNDLNIGNNDSSSSYSVNFNGGNYHTELRALDGGFMISPDSDNADTYFNFQPTSLLYGNPETSYEYHFPSQSGTLALTSDVPTTYIKSVSVSGNTLTLTKQDNTTEKFTPSSSGGGGGFTLLYSGSCNDIDGSTGTEISNSGLYAISGYIDAEHLGTLIGSSYLNDKLFIEVIGGGDSRASSTIFPLTKDFGYYRFYGIWDDTIDGAIMGSHDEMNIYKLG